MPKIKIGGIIQNRNLAHIGILNFPDRMGMLSRILEVLGEERLNLQFIVHSMDGGGSQSLVFCIRQEDLEKTLAILCRIHDALNPHRVVHQVPVSIISIFGPHFREKPSIAATMFGALEKAKVPILAVSTSISSLSCVVEETLLPVAVEAIHEAFEMP